MVDSYGTLFLSHIAEDINDSPFFSGKDNLLLLHLLFPSPWTLNLIEKLDAQLVWNWQYCAILNSQRFWVADGIPKEGLRIQDVLVRLAILHLIRDKVAIISTHISK